MENRRPGGTGEKTVYDTRLLLTEFVEILFDHFQDGIYVTDGDAVTIYLNSSYERISGLTRDEMVGRNMKDLVDNGVISISGTLAVLESKENVTIEQSFRTGKRAVITSIPIFMEAGNDDSIVMVVTVVRETTEFYQIKKELRKKERQNRTYVRQLEQTGAAALSIPEGFSLKEEVARIEASYIEAAFQKCGNVRDAAAMLGIDGSTFVRKRQRYEQAGLLETRGNC